jgi:hypothetical protein
MAHSNRRLEFKETCVADFLPCLLLKKVLLRTSLGNFCRSTRVLNNWIKPFQPFYNHIHRQS